MDKKTKQDLLKNRKKKLDELQKKTKELAKYFSKPKVSKIARVQDECKMSINLPLKSIQPEIDLTWSPPPKIKSIKKIPKTTKNAQNKLPNELNTTFKIDRYSNITTDCKNTIQVKKLIDKEPKIRVVTKPETLFATLELNDDYQPPTSDLFSIQTPKIVKNNISLIKNENNNIVLEEMCDNEKTINTVDDISLNREISNINLCRKPFDSRNSNTEIITILKKQEEKLNSFDSRIEYIMEYLKLFFKQNVLENKCSESTQTDNYYDNLLHLFCPKTPPPPLNIISVLKCKYNLQQKAMFEVNKHKRILSNQISTPINIDTKNLKEVKNVEVQTDNKFSLQSTNLLFELKEKSRNEKLKDINIQNNKLVLKDIIIFKLEKKLNSKAIKMQLLKETNIDLAKQLKNMNLKQTETLSVTEMLKNLHKDNNELRELVKVQKQRIEELSNRIMQIKETNNIKNSHCLSNQNIYSTSSTTDESNITLEWNSDSEEDDIIKEAYSKLNALENKTKKLSEMSNQRRNKL